MAESKKPQLDLTLFQIRALRETDASLVGAFSCADEDLDDFIRNDAFRYQRQNVARTYLGFVEGRAVGFLTLAMDAIRLTSSERKKIKDANGDRLKHDELPVIPAVKLARLGACAKLKTEVRGLGEHLVRTSCLIVLSAADSVGCRLLTVDAYPDVVDFYKKLGFVHNQDKSYADNSHPSMRLDLFGNTLNWLG